MKQIVSFNLIFESEIINWLIYLYSKLNSAGMFFFSLKIFKDRGEFSRIANETHKNSLKNTGACLWKIYLWLVPDLYALELL